MDFKKEIETNRDAFVKDLKGLLQIPSIAGEAQGDDPFGHEVQNALDYMLHLGKSMGFDVKNVDNYGAHIDFKGTEDGIMGIVGHIDVVPAGEGWTYPPFDGTLEGDFLYGRGVQDDKGPTMLGLYAMKVLKDMGIQPKKTIRLILGLDEETNWEGMKYYLAHEQAPDFGIVPDADFPLIQCEKGLLQVILKRNHSTVEPEDSTGKDRDGCVLLEAQGGSAPNIVPDKTDFILGGTAEALASAEALLLSKASEKSYKIATSLDQSALRLTVKVEGKPAHAAHPERGFNAISAAMDLLGALPILNEEASKLIQLYNHRIGFVTDGSNIGCGFSDDLSGKLTFNVGGLLFNQQESRLVMDIRCPVTFTKEAVLEGIAESTVPFGFETELLDYINSIYQESDHPVVVTLLEVYRKISGDMESQPAAIGGATFARAIPNCMAFGPLFPGDAELEHQKDEGVSVSQLLKAGEIYTECIYRLCCE